MTAPAVAVRERPILFSGPMVRAILDGRKTQTRRVLDVPADTRSVRWAESVATTPPGVYTGWVVECGAPLLLPRRCPYGQPGDRLWVRETWTAEFEWPETLDGPRLHFYHKVPPGWRGAANAHRVYYAADGAEYTVLQYAPGDIRLHDTGRRREHVKRWAPSIHMPRWASRIQLEITEVHVERVQAIGEADAEAEGAMAEFEVDIATFARGGALPPSTHRLGYKHLWDSINAARGFGWDVNPFVWVLSFRRLV